MGEMAVLGKEGDTKFMWDPKVDFEVDDARARFDKYIKEGYLAFHVDKEGNKAKPMKKFDPKAGKIILTPAPTGG